MASLPLQSHSFPPSGGGFQQVEYSTLTLIGRADKGVGVSVLVQ